MCPACGVSIKDDDDHIWWFYGKEYCSEKCVRAVRLTHQPDYPRELY